MRNGAQAFGTLAERAPAQLGNTVFGNYDVDIAARDADRLASERCNDARMLAVGRCRRDRNNGAPARRGDGASNKIRQPANSAEITACRNFGIYVACQINFDTGIDSVQVWQPRQHLLVVCVFGTADFDLGVSVGEIHQTAAAEKPAGDDSTGINSLARIGDHTFFHQVNDDVRNNAAMHAEVFMVQKRPAYGHRQSANAELYRCAIRYQPRDMRSDPHVDICWLRVGHQHLVRIAFRQNVDIFRGDQCILCGHWQTVVNLGDHTACCLYHCWQKICHDAHGKIAGLRMRPYAQEHNVDLDDTGADEAGHGRYIGRNDIQQVRRSEVAGGASTVETAKS